MMDRTPLVLLLAALLTGCAGATPEPADGPAPARVPPPGSARERSIIHCGRRARTRTRRSPDW
jgi:hypothetical protein